MRGDSADPVDCVANDCASASPFVANAPAQRVGGEARLENSVCVSRALSHRGERAREPASPRSLSGGTNARRVREKRVGAVEVRSMS